MMELKRYQVNIVVDWGYTDNGVLRSLLHISPELAKLYGWGCLTWEDGLWELDDLRAVRIGVVMMRDGIHFIGGNYNSLVGPVDVDRVPTNQPLTDPKTRVLHFGVDRTDFSYKFNAMVHEMGHEVMLHNPQTMNYFMSQLGATCSNYNPLVSHMPFCNKDQVNGGKYNVGPIDVAGPLILQRKVTGKSA